MEERGDAREGVCQHARMHRALCDAGRTPIQPAAVFDRARLSDPRPLLRFLIYLVQALKLTGHT